MIKNTFLFLLACASTAAAHVDSSDIAGDYQGTINGHIRITMTLTRDGDGGMTGQYRYVKYGQPVYLKAMPTPDAETIALDEQGSRADDNIKGHFTGTIDAAGSFTGTWTNANETRKYPFSLQQIDSIDKYAATDPAYHVQASVPHFLADTPFYSALNAKLSSAARDEVLTNVADLKDQTADAAHGPLPYDNTSSMEVLYADNAMVSILRMDSSYEGGAHGNYGYNAHVYIWKAGKVKELTTPAMLAATSAPRLATLIQADLVRQKAAWPEQKDMSKLSALVINPTADGLVFTFNPYEVDCFAAGAYSVMIPYRQIASAVPINSPLKRLMGQ
jgi:hypothetical protein